MIKNQNNNRYNEVKSIRKDVRLQENTGILLFYYLLT